MFDKDAERRKRKARRERNKYIKSHKQANQGRKPGKSERKLNRWDEEAA